MPSNPGKRNRRTRWIKTCNGECGIQELHPVHACQKESPVEAQAVNPHQVSTQPGNNDEHWYPPSPQPQGESVHQSTVGRSGASSLSTRTQALRVAPGPDVETRSSKGQSQACGKKTQASQEGGGHSPLEPEAEAPTFTFEIRSTPTTSLEKRETTHTSPKEEIADFYPCPTADSPCSSPSVRTPQPSPSADCHAPSYPSSGVGRSMIPNEPTLSSSNGVNTNCTLAPNNAHISATSLHPQKSSFSQDGSCSQRSTKVDLYHAPVLSPPKPCGRSKLLAVACPTVCSAWANGGLHPPFANTVHPQVTKERQGQKNSKPALPPIAPISKCPTDPSNNQLNKLVEATHPYFASPTRNRRHQVVGMAMRAENERLENALNEFLFGYQKIPGLGHNITEVCNSELSLPKHLQQCRNEANDITATPETDAKKSFLRKDEINWETLPDDGEGFIEWPRLSELIWKSSGLDMITLRLDD